MRWDETTTINATLRYSDGTFIKDVPYGTKYTLQITDGTAATLSGNVLLPKELVGVPNKTVTVTGTAVDDTSVTGTCQITIIARNKPGAPTLKSATPGHASVVLDWDTLTDDGGDDITKYNVLYSTSSSADPEFLASTAPDVTEYTATSLTDGVTYYFYLRAANAQGGGPLSASLSATPFGTVPGKPVSLTATPGDKQVSLSWSDPDDGGSALTEYRIYYNDGSGNILFTHTPKLATSDTVTGLANGTEYTFSVYAYNSEGSSPAATVKATPSTTPGAPASLTVTSADSTSILLSWPVANDGGSALQGYKVYYNDGTGDHEFPRSGDALDRTETVTGLTSSTEYTLSVYAYNANGTSASSASAVQETDP